MGLVLKLVDGSELGRYELASPPCLGERMLVDGREMTVAAVDYLGTPPAVAAATLVVPRDGGGDGDTGP